MNVCSEVGYNLDAHGGKHSDCYNVAAAADFKEAFVYVSAKFLSAARLLGGGNEARETVAEVRNSREKSIDPNSMDIY